LISLDVLLRCGEDEFGLEWFEFLLLLLELVGGDGETVGIYIGFGGVEGVGSGVGGGVGVDVVTSDDDLAVAVEALVVYVVLSIGNSDWSAMYIKETTPN
jgi:hypothetical protein